MQEAIDYFYESIKELSLYDTGVEVINTGVKQ